LNVPAGSVVVVIDGGNALMGNCRAFSTVCDVASVSIKMWVAVLVTIGVPLMTPFVLSVRPLGRNGEPLLRPHM
jgi:hypothetical protein